MARILYYLKRMTLKFLESFIEVCLGVIISFLKDDLKAVETPFFVRSSEIHYSQFGREKLFHRPGKVARWFGRHPYFLVTSFIVIGGLLILIFVIILPICTNSDACNIHA